MKRQIGLLALFLLVMSAFSPGVRGQDSTRIVHELGEVVVKKNPETVVVFDYAALDILAYLGIEPTGVAKSSLPDYLAHFRDETYADVGTLFEPNFERIYALQPDVIFVSTRQARFIQNWHGLPHQSIWPSTLETTGVRLPTTFG